MNLTIAITDGFRAWGAAATLFALPVLLPFILNAFRGAAMAARLEWQLAFGGHPRWRSFRVFLLALWREGSATPVRINTWVGVVLLIFLVIAGSGIFIASTFSTLGYYDPALTAAMLLAWTLLSTGGWIFTISTARSEPSMGVAAFLLLVSFMGLALEIKGFV